MRQVDWVQSAAMLVRREAADEIGYFDPQFFVYSDEVDFCRRLADAGWHTLYVPGARAVHHEQLSTGNVPSAPDRRVLAQPRPLHAQAPLGRSRRALVRCLTAWTLRAARRRPRSCCPGHDPKRYAKHVTRDAAPATAAKACAEAAESSTGG